MATTGAVRRGERLRRAAHVLLRWLRHGRNTVRHHEFATEGQWSDLRRDENGNRAVPRGAGIACPDEFTLTELNVRLGHRAANPLEPFPLRWRGLRQDARDHAI